MKNWKTTLVGILLGGGVSIDALIQQGLTDGWHQALIGFAIAILGYFAKDHDVTGGKKSLESGENPQKPPKTDPPTEP